LHHHRASPLQFALEILMMLMLMLMLMLTPKRTRFRNLLRSLHLFDPNHNPT
jgi:hypothetical protein